MLACFLAYAPDMICSLRILFSVSVLFLGKHPIAPYLFAVALMSDLFDGWLFRRYTKGSPYWRRWNPLPITLDPIADLALMICGVNYVGHYLYSISWGRIVLVTAVVGSIVLAFSVVPNLVSMPEARLVYTVVETAKTHVSCFIMVTSTIGVWRVNYPGSWHGAMVTIVLFYAIFLVIGDKKRLVRRPPEGWREG